MVTVVRYAMVTVSGEICHGYSECGEICHGYSVVRYPMVTVWLAGKQFIALEGFNFLIKII